MKTCELLVDSMQQEARRSRRLNEVRIDEQADNAGPKVSDLGVESLGGHFATLCREFDFYEVKRIYYNFQMKREKLLHF